MVSSSNPAPYESLTVEALAQRLADAPETLQLIDVREPNELEIVRLEGFESLPLSQFSAWSETIHSRFEADKETVVMCHHGVRSAQMCLWLSEQGFTQLKNLTGGIDAYAVKIDDSLPRY